MQSDCLKLNCIALVWVYLCNDTLNPAVGRLELTVELSRTTRSAPRRFEASVLVANFCTFSFKEKVHFEMPRYGRSDAIYFLRRLVEFLEVSEDHQLRPLGASIWFSEFCITLISLSGTLYVEL